jgi:hypothetical protein
MTKTYPVTLDVGSTSGCVGRALARAGVSDKLIQVELSSNLPFITK